MNQSPMTLAISSSDGWIPSKDKVVIMQLEYDVDDSGNRFLSGRLFENVQFSDLEIAPRMGSPIRIEDCRFLNCSTSLGTCLIRRGTTLDSVVFSNLDCGDAIHVSSEVCLNRVVIEGKKPKSLFIKPQDRETFKMPEVPDTDFQLDITNFSGTVDIEGLRGNMVRKDPSRHVTIQAKWRDEVDWKGMGIGGSSYWKIFVRKLAYNNADEGVFSLPGRSHDDFSEVMHQKELLKNAGLRFD
ncbi:hypothetical protein ACYFX5_05335 [Bremerella sp. T1]|uniref:hypothetical protein n=1 Tax=Bremerella sp. TYQ1 TaxID=3119568 RepID=UPI001CCDE232|nr:hypothetical protein [Bremerella volcania]UBM37680.1 hypothetical protein LA756_07275 [Bremerella volcania]